MTDSQRPPMPPPGSRGIPPGSVPPGRMPPSSMPPGQPPARRMPPPDPSMGTTQRPTDETVVMPTTPRNPGMPPTTARNPGAIPPPPGVRTPGGGTTTAPGTSPGMPSAGTAPTGGIPSAPPRQQPPAPSPPAAPAASAAPTAPSKTVSTTEGKGRSPGQPTLEEVVKQAFENGVSDIHVGVGEIPRYRKRGDINPTEYPETDYPTFMSWLQEVMSDEEIEKFEETLDFDGVTQYEFSRARLNVFGSMKGPAMVMRLIPNNILSMEQLNLPQVFRDICHYHKGLILVTGPTGSGKSTTMAAMIDYINKNMAKHIITIEDPIEFVHTSRKSLIKHREVGQHTRKFDNALKAALREDPDLILVGEMRDKETVNTALKAAQTGHLVAGTLHTNSAVKTIERILNLYSAEEQASMKVAIAESLVAIVAQGLCKTTDGKRAAYHDILINTDSIKEYIMQGKYEEITGVMLKSKFDGMQTMNQALLALYQEGRITEEEALEKSPTPNEMAQFLRGRV